MPSRRKLDRDRINELLMITCPHCESKLSFADCQRMDGEHLKCPRCGKQFKPGRDNRKLRCQTRIQTMMGRKRCCQGFRMRRGRRYQNRIATNRNLCSSGKD